MPSSDALIVVEDWISEHFFTTDARKESFQLEGFFTRVGGEEVLADPIFDDDQGVTAWHGHTPHERSGSFPARRRAGAAPTSAAAPYRR